MAQRVLSITLGSEIVKICEASSAGSKKVQVYNAIDLVIPQGLCEDGVIQNAESLASVILQGMSGEGFTAKKIVFSIASKRIASKEAIIPYCKENRIMDIVRVNAPEYFPISNLEEYVVNYSILDVVQNENVKNYRLSVVATPRDILADYYELARLMGMSVVGLDYAGNAILQLLKLQTEGDEVVAILQMSTENTVVSIMSGKTLIMQRSVPYGRGVLLEAICTSRSVPSNVADLMLIEEDISYVASTNEEVADAVRSLFSSINRIIEFYSSRNPERPLDHIYMIGDVISVNGLVELFNREWTEHSVELIGHLHGVEIKNTNNVSYEIASNYLANLGALLNPLNISLTEDKKQEKAEASLPWWILIVSVIVSAAMVGGILFIHNMAKKENDDLRERIAKYDAVENYEAKYLASQAEVEAMNNWYDSTKSANESIARLIEDLEEVQPAAVAITQFTTKDGEVSINGTSYGKPAIAEFIIQLKKLPYIKNVQTDYINESIDNYSAKDVFVINLTLEYSDPYNEEADSESEAEVVFADGDASDSDGILVEDVTDQVTGNGDASDEEGGDN